MDYVTRIGTPDLPGMIGGIVRVSKLRDGRYALSDMYLPGTVRFFGPDGTYMSTLGRQGYGPREFQTPLFHFIEETGDTLFIIDIGLGRISAFSPDGARLYDTRVASLGRPLRGDFLEDGSFIANSIRLSPEGVGLPLHLMSTAGQVSYSFGSDFPVHLAQDNVHFRNVHIDDGDTLWVAHGYQYRLEKWEPRSDPDAPFVLDTTFAPGTVEFPPLADRQTFPRSRDDRPPSPSVRGVWREPGGPVWVILWVARDDWQDRFDRFPDDLVIDSEFYSAERSYRKTRLEAVDPRTGQVVASRELDEPWMEFIGDGEAYSYKLIDGIPYLDVWTVQLR